jgi:hypothetical protein
MTRIGGVTRNDGSGTPAPAPRATLRSSGLEAVVAADGAEETPPSTEAGVVD